VLRAVEKKREQALADRHGYGVCIPGMHMSSVTVNGSGEAERDSVILPGWRNQRWSTSTSW
jgi:hypothetical protein